MDHPGTNDVIVRLDEGGRSACVLHAALRADDSAFPTREEAVARALMLAEREHVRAWLTDEGSSFALLEDFREVGSA